MDLGNYSREWIVVAEYFHEPNFLRVSDGIFELLRITFEKQIGLGFHLL